MHNQFVHLLLFVGMWDMVQRVQGNSIQRLERYNRTDLNLWTRFPYNFQQNNQLLQLDGPLDRWRCNSNRFRNLRTCWMLNHPGQAARLSKIAKPYLCDIRDRWTDSRPRRIQKRSINQCTGGLTKKLIISAREVRNPSVMRELVHDPSNHLYQSMLIESCKPNMQVSGLRCRMHDIAFKAAVWPLDPTSNNIEVMDVMTKVYCALA